MLGYKRGRNIQSFTSQFQQKFKDTVGLSGICAKALDWRSENSTHFNVLKIFYDEQITMIFLFKNITTGDGTWD
jgi:hypothetical protein